jgi:hypothetical protein
MADPVATVAVLKSLPALLEPLSKLRLQQAGKKEAFRAAVKSMQAAVVATKTYLADVERHHDVGRHRETKLAELWAEASLAFMNVRPEITERLQLKAEFWTDPSAWTREQVREAGISLNAKAELLRQLLVEGK